MSYENILVEKRDAVTLVTLNRPQALNALNTSVLKDLIDAFAASSACCNCCSVSRLPSRRCSAIFCAAFLPTPGNWRNALTRESSAFTY